MCADWTVVPIRWRSVVLRILFRASCNTGNSEKAKIYSFSYKFRKLSQRCKAGLGDAGFDSVMTSCCREYIMSHCYRER